MAITRLTLTNNNKNKNNSKLLKINKNNLIWQYDCHKTKTKRKQF